MALGMEVGFGPGHIVLDDDPVPPQEGHTPNFRLMFVVAKWLDGSRYHLVRSRLGPGHIVLQGDPSLPMWHCPAPNFRPMSIVATVAHLSYC